jgi:hypothetical protein
LRKRGHTDDRSGCALVRKLGILPFFLNIVEAVSSNRCTKKGDSMSDLIIIAEMLETVLLDESMRERVLDAMDLSDAEADRVLKKYISFVNDAIVAEGVK